MNSRSDLLEMIDSAQRGVDLETEETQHPGVEDALINAAQRGVIVRVVTVAAHVEQLPGAGNAAMG